jgi:hypothetical protein
VTELARIQDAAVMNPLSGELVPLDSPTDTLGRYLADVREFEQGLRSAKRQVSDELLARMDADACYTAHLGDVTVEGDGPGRVEYDAEGLWHALRPFVDAGTITEAALDRAVERVWTFKSKAAGIKALLKQGGRLAGVVEQFSRPSEKPRNVRVKA